MNSGPEADFPSVAKGLRIMAALLEDESAEPWVRVGAAQLVCYTLLVKQAEYDALLRAALNALQIADLSFCGEYCTGDGEQCEDINRHPYVHLAARIRKVTDE